MRNNSEAQANAVIILLTILAITLILSSCSTACYSGFCNTYSNVEQAENLNRLN